MLLSPNQCSDDLIRSQSDLIAFIFVISRREQQILQRTSEENSICRHITAKVTVIWQGACVCLCVCFCNKTCHCPSPEKHGKGWWKLLAVCCFHFCHPPEGRHAMQDVCERVCVTLKGWLVSTRVTVIEFSFPLMTSSTCDVENTRPHALTYLKQH